MLREMFRAFAQRMMDAEVEAACGAGYGEVSPERVNSRNGYRHAGVGHPGRDGRAGDPEAAARHLLPVVPGAPPAGRAGAGHGRRHLVPAGRLDPAGGEAGRGDGRDEAEQVAGQRDGRRAGRAGRGVPEPPAGRRAVHLHVDRRAHPEGPRGRPHGQRALPDRHRGQRRRAPGDPRHRGRPAPRTARAGWRSCAAWSPAACPASRWSPPTTTPGW